MMMLDLEAWLTTDLSSVDHSIEKRHAARHTASIGMFTGWTVRYALDEVQYVRTILEAVPFAQPLYSYSCET